MSKTFKPGDRIEFLGEWEKGINMCSAQPGATGTVGPQGITKKTGCKYVDIIWDRDNKLAGNQMNGLYNPKDFKLKKAGPPLRVKSRLEDLIL